MKIFPTAHEIAVAIVAAARLHDEDPILTVEGAIAIRGRWLAIAALQEEFPQTDHAWIASSCGVTGRARSQNARSEIRSKRFGREYNRAKWFRETDLEIVKSALAEAIIATDSQTPIAANLTAMPAVPEWVRIAGLSDEFTSVAIVSDEHEAAAHCRRLKQGTLNGRVSA